MNIYFVEGKRLARQLATTAGLPYAELDHFRTAVSAAKLPEAMVSKLAVAMLKQIPDECIVFGVDVDDNPYSLADVAATSDKCSLVVFAGDVRETLRDVNIGDVIDGVDVLARGLSLATEESGEEMWRHAHG